MSTLKNLKIRNKKSGMQKRFRNYYKGGRQLYNDVMYLKRLINVEFKFKEGALADQTIGSTSPTAFYALLNGLSNGTGAGQRIGSSIKNASIQLNLEFKLAGALNKDYIRCVLVWVKNVDGTAPVYANNDANSIYTGATPNSMRQLTNRNKFIILRDWHINLDADGISQRYIRYYRKLNNHTIFGTTSVGDVTDINNGALYLVAISQSGTAPDTSTITYNSRVRFIDN